MAGLDPDKADKRRIVAACLKSCAVAASWAQSRARDTRRMVEMQREEIKRRKAG